MRPARTLRRCRRTGVAEKGAARTWQLPTSSWGRAGIAVPPLGGQPSLKPLSPPGDKPSGASARTEAPTPGPSVRGKLALLGPCVLRQRTDERVVLELLHDVGGPARD